jgi:hypothetical protein
MMHFCWNHGKITSFHDHTTTAHHGSAAQSQMTQLR